MSFPYRIIDEICGRLSLMRDEIMGWNFDGIDAADLSCPANTRRQIERVM